MNITTEWLQQNNACEDGLTWFLGQNATCLDTIIPKLLNKGHFDWANWTLTHAMTHRQQVQYALFAAEQVIELYEKQYPGDDRPRNAIESAKHFVATGNKGTARAASAAASHAATCATDPERLFNGAASAATSAAHAATCAADPERLFNTAASAAADAAHDAASAAHAAAHAAHAADCAADATAMKKKILYYGLCLLA